MNHFIDTEFIESENGIQLVSIGIASEDGRTFYAEVSDFDPYTADSWVKANVLTKLKFWRHRDFNPGEEPFRPGYATRSGGNAALEVYGTQEFIRKWLLEYFHPEIDRKPIFYGYYCDYDWVLFARLFGRLINKPEHFPMYCLDLKQMMDERGLTKDWKRTTHPDPEGEHDALVDALWNKQLFFHILDNADTTTKAMRAATANLVAAQGRMLDKWADGDENVKTDLWTKLHEAGQVAHDILHYSGYSDL